MGLHGVVALLLMTVRCARAMQKLVLSMGPAETVATAPACAPY